MHVFNFLAFSTVAITVAFAAPRPQDHASAAPRSEQLYYLRTNAPNEPWHGRWLIALPTSYRLGLENLTVDPPTPPVTFLPVSLDNGNYALRGEGTGDDPSDAPYLAALDNMEGTQTLSMAVVYLSSPSRYSSNDDLEACPKGYECTADQWVVDEADGENVYTNFRFAGFKGDWEPFKDSPSDGWHVYWKGDFGTHPTIQLDLVPYTPNTT